MTPDPCFPSGSDEHQCRLRAVAAAGSSGTIVACRPFISRLLGAANLGFPVLIRPNFLFADNAGAEPVSLTSVSTNWDMISRMIAGRLGHYDIQEKLGAGGMGEVYKAFDTRLRRIVAVKVLPAERVADAIRKDLFIKEARAASALNHPNIIVIHDAATENGIDFLVMEYVPGRTLQQGIPRNGLSLSNVLRYALQIADALAAAHSAGIVHRDLKPSNIMITEHGRVKVLDFGLAKLIEQACAGPEMSTRTAHMSTEPGTVAGSPAYMSPEQAEGRTVDLRSDIFSFGAVLYEMITGHRAFDGDSAASIMAAVLKEQPRPAAELVKALPHELDLLVSRCLRKDVSRRSQSMAEIKLQLEDLKQEYDSEALPVVSTSRSRLVPLLFAAVLIMLLVAAGVWTLTDRRSAPPFHRLRQITRNEGVSTFPALSPDGKLLAYASDQGGQGNLDIWVQQVAGGDAIRLTRHRADEHWPRFSPDASQLVFVRQGEGIYLISSLGGTERLLVKSGSMPAYSPDGKWIAYYTGYQGSRELWELFVVPSTAGAPRRVETGLATVCCPVWSPDGSHLLVEGSTSGTGLDQGDWFIVSFDDGKAVKVGREMLRQAGLSYLSSPVSWIGNNLIFGAGQGGIFALRPAPYGAGQGGTQNIWRVFIEPGSWALRGKPERLTAGSGEYPGPASLDGRIPFSTDSGTMNIYALPLDVRRGTTNGELVRIVHGSGRAGHPSLARDGRKLVFTSDRTGSNDIWIKDLTTGVETLAIGTPEDERRGLISPDGSQMAFQRFTNSVPRNYLWPLPAGPETEICKGCLALLNWTADGRSLVISEGEPNRLMAFDVATGQRTLVASHPKYSIHDGSLSPDKRWIMFKLITSPTAQPVFIAPVRNGSAVPETEWVRITGDYYHQKPFWSPDGALVYYYSTEDNFNCLYARRLQPATKQPQGPAVAVQHFHGALRPAFVVGYGIAPDRLYIPMVSTRSDVWLAEPGGTR